MEEYARVAQDQIEKQWNKGINPALYNGYSWYKKRNIIFDILLKFKECLWK